jgi:hypothetical protein
MIKRYITTAIRTQFVLDKKMNIVAFLTMNGANGIVADQRAVGGAFLIYIFTF